MPPVVIDTRNADDIRDVVHRAVQALAEGRLVAFPTETVYDVAASALVEDAVRRLAAIKQPDGGRPLTLAIKSAEDALDYVPDMTPLARRLSRRCWPGPVTLLLEDRHPESLIKQLPPATREAVQLDGWVGLRVPAHDIILETLRLLAGPIVMTSAARSDQPESTTAEQVVASLGDDVQLVLDDGPSRFGQPSSIVRVAEQDLQIVRPGVVSEQVLKRLGSMMILFVCTGNTCRSPMAETLCRKLLADKLGCGVDQLEERGIVIMSAGIAAMMGGRPSPESVMVMSEMGLDLKDHESQPLTPQLVRHADVILPMTRSHMQAILSEWPDVAERVRLVSSDGGDVADPIGGTMEHYQMCAAEIKNHLSRWIDEFDLSSGIPPA